MINPAPFKVTFARGQFIGIRSPYPLWEMYILDDTPMRVVGKSSKSPIPNQEALEKKLRASKHVISLEIHPNTLWISHLPDIDVGELHDHAVRILKEHFTLRISPGG